MRLFQSVLIVLLFLCTRPVFAQEQTKVEEEKDGSYKLLSLSYGRFYPGSELKFYDFNPGTDVALNFTRMIRNSLAVAVSLRYYTSDINSDRFRGNLSSTGVEILLTFQKNMARLQPYIGGGLGIYLVDLEIKDRLSYDSVSENDAGYGPVVRAGVRALVSDRVFAGGFARYFHTITPLSEFANSLSWGGLQIPDKKGFTFNVEAGWRF